MSADELVAAIVADCLERLARGETIDLDEVVRSHADLADALRPRLFVLRRLERAYAADATVTRPPAPPSLAGTRLGPYRLDAVLGTGGMGTVYRAVREGARPETVAVKVVHPHLAARASFRDRFRREARIGRSVVHENVVRTLDAGDAIDARGVRLDFLVMEYVEGRTLRALGNDLGRVPEELCRHVGREVAKALVAIHGASAVHRDVKPENVLITTAHVVKVMDLGVARLDDEAARLSQTGAFVGSVRYAAPEQFHGRKTTVDGRADLYALGLTLYELATGKHPFDDDDFATVLRRQMDEIPQRAGELNPQLSPYFEELLHALLSKDRAQRPASAEELLRVLEAGEDSPWWRDRARSIREATRRPLRRVRIPRETALYGRDAELARLRTLFEKAKAGDGQVVLVEGEAGIGKSRLVDEFVGQLSQAGEDVNFLFGSYPPGGAATASGAFSVAYREHFGDDAAAMHAALPQTRLLVPAFAALLRGDVAPAGAEPLTKDSLQTVFVHATRSLAAQRPTIVLLDDLHFAPEEGRALFAALALAVPGHRILLVGAARPGLDEKWLAQIERLGHTTRIPLPRLGVKDLVALLVAALKSQHLAEELSSKIALKSDGNPFFVFEILRGLREGHFITRRPDGTWATTREIREVEVPSSVVELVQARVSELGRADRSVLEVAACVGFEFDPALVGDVLRIDRIPLLQRLGRIEKTRRLVRSAGRRFVFDHHQVMEVLYAGLSEPLREEYQAALGSAIEARSGAASKEPRDLDGGLCVDLAEHFLKGAQGARGLRYLDAAMTHLERNYLINAAVHLADRALTVPELVEGKDRCVLLIRKAWWLAFLGRHADERTALEEALRLSGAADDVVLRIRVMRALACHDAFGTEFDAAQVRLREALELASASGDRMVEAGIRGQLGRVLGPQGRYEEARALHAHQLEVARQVGDRRGEADALHDLGIVLIWLSRLDEAQSCYEQALQMAREAADLHAEGHALGALGWIAAERGEYEEACSLLARSLEIALRIGSRASEARARKNLGIALLSLGRFDDARRHYERALAISREVGDREGDAIGHLNLGEVRAWLGDLGGALGDLREALALVRESGLRRVEGYVLLALGDLLGFMGDTASATRHLEDAVALRRSMNDRGGLVKSLMALADVRRRLGEFGVALALVEEAGSITGETGSVLDLLFVALTRARLPDGRADELVALFAACRDKLSASEEMEVRLDLWRMTGLLSHLVEAKRHLDRVVALAPPEFRESMLTNVRLHREIAAAARENGLA